MASQEEIIQSIINQMNGHDGTRGSYLNRAEVVRSGTGAISGEITRIEGLPVALDTRLQGLLLRLETVETKGTGSANTKVQEADALYAQINKDIDTLESTIAQAEAELGISGK